ncbi:MAG: right-handed parallel beta-helix repeat-containing protein, partial [Clostridia bacterium]|nr:right-handed parallel beta-helix repeat-containing protein [Clostridia bacterium]
MAHNYHVSVSGSDTWAGSAQRPLRTIQRAADLARPGDTVTIHEGVYREHVNPVRGGAGDTERILYTAAPGEKPVISGAERVSDWERIGDGVYRTVLPNTMFGDFNPYKETVGGDWFRSLERDFHLGEVYINGKSMFEVSTLDEVMDPKPFTEAREPEWSLHAWCCGTDENSTTIYARFGEFDPARENIEINVRRFCFWPEKTGIDYITVRGLHLTMAAPNWAPPTALQEGLIGPHWSKGWIIEDCEISNAKNSGISLGKEITTGHNEWYRLGSKHGTQRERDVIFNALRIGWNRENIGSHIIRRNVIHDCEQTGICGHLGAVFSQILDNHIYNIHHKRMFNGAEVGGIKLHASIDCRISGNHIHNCDRGLWMDWQAQGTRISGNLLYDNDTEDLFVEVSHGPYLVDNNLFLSTKNLRDMSQGGAYVHNLFAGFFTWKRVTNRFTPYHYNHDTAVHGLMTILGGDDRFYNNIFTGTLPDNALKEQKIEEGTWAGSDLRRNADGSIPKGLSIYDECPAEGEAVPGRRMQVDEYAEERLPMACGSNLYLNDARPYRKESGSLACPEVKPRVEVITEADGVYLLCDLGGRAGAV